MTPATEKKPTAAEVLACLERSGYLLESRLVRQLVAQGFFVEPNQAVLDPRTAKSREIDILAEHYGADSSRHSVVVKSHFVMEAFNNKLPIVLLTERPESPVLAADESYLNFGCSPEPFPYYAELDFFDGRLLTEGQLFSQFCALTEKKSGNSRELMASHPDDLYGSLLKLAEYVEAKLTSWNAEDGLSRSKTCRVFFWHPIVVVGGDLLIARVGQDGQVSPEARSSAFLEFNWHASDTPQTTLIEFISSAALLPRLAELVKYDAALEEKGHQLIPPA